MSYLEPVTDRSASDIVAKNSKAYFNVLDWIRIYGNALYVNNEIATVLFTALPFTTISYPTVNSIPKVADFNALIANIEVMRLFVNGFGAAVSPITVLVWKSGFGEAAPSYIDVNQWELTIDLIKQFVDPLSVNYIICGLAVTGSQMILIKKHMLLPVTVYIICGVATAGGDPVMDGI